MFIMGLESPSTAVCKFFHFSSVRSQPQLLIFEGFDYESNDSFHSSRPPIFSVKAPCLFPL
jgi:hypothetical protein